MKIKSLNCAFLSDADIMNLNRMNIHTSEQIISYADLDGLSRKSQVSLKSLKMLKKSIIGQYAPFPQLASDLLAKYVRNLFIIKFGCKKIDDLISKGVYSSEITEISGPSGIGKSQMCLNLVVNMLSINQKHTCLYIDSNKNFCTRRIQQLLKTPSTTLQSVKIIDCQNFFHLLDILSQIKKSCATNQSNSSNDQALANPNLLVVDSLTSLFYSLFNKPSVANNLEISFYYNSIMSALGYLATNMNMTVVITTNSSSNEIGQSSVFNESWKKFSSVQVVLRELNSTERLELLDCVPERVNDTRVFEVVKCSRPILDRKNNDNRNFCNFKFNESGFE